MLNLLQMLTLRLNHGTMVDMDGHTMAVTGMERGQLTRNPHPMLMPRPNHGTDGDMVGHTMVDMVGHTMVVIGMERGLLIPNQPQMLMPTMEDTDGHTMARGLPTQNPLPLLMPRLNHGTTAATDTDGPT